MWEPKCVVCGQPAAIHETVVQAGTAVTRHFCPEHGAAALPPLVPGSPDAARQAAQEHFDRLSDAEKEHYALLYRLGKRGT
jgi:hypothetical protein